MRALVWILACLLLGGCGGSNEGPANAPTPAPSANAAASESAGAPPPASTGEAGATKKRTRTSAARPPAHDGTKPKNGRPLNPKDGGRTVFAGADDRCFVEMPTKETSPDGRLVRATEHVDCPAEMNDPAWDHCTAQIVVDEGGGKCFCVSGAPPRPMPFPTPCPAGASAK
jgi:hypothetical protein